MKLCLHNRLGRIGRSKAVRKSRRRWRLFTVFYNAFLASELPSQMVNDAVLRNYEAFDILSRVKGGQDGK